MKLTYLATAGLDDLKTHIIDYKDHYQDNTNQWFVDFINDQDYLVTNDKFSYDEFTLQTVGEYNDTDFLNVKIFYSALKDLPVNIAADERLWSAMAHRECWEYVKYRKRADFEKNDLKKLRGDFFLAQSARRALFINPVSRLWWAGYLTYDESRADPYELTKLICKRAFASNIMLISSSNLTARKENMLGILSAISKLEREGYEIKRAQFVEANKYLNKMGAVTIIDVLAQDEIENRVLRHLKKTFNW